jgi:hypothetical protein
MSSAVRERAQPAFVKALAALIWLVGMASLLWQIHFWFLYLQISPVTPHPKTGQIYPLRVHEQIVYLTRQELSRVDGPWLWIAFGCVAMFLLLVFKLKQTN